jgi:hypothetical protein
MPIEYTRELARLAGKCTINEANAFHEWLQQHPRGQVDLRQCEHLHMGILQLLMAAKPGIAAAPENRFLQHLLPYLR